MKEASKGSARGYDPPMPHWLTTHYPHGTPDDTPWFIYLSDYPRPDRTPAPGDDVLFYETKSTGPTDVQGRGAIVLAATVLGPPEPANPKSGGRACQFRCGNYRSGRAVTYADVVRLTRHKVLMGRDGLFPLTVVEFEALVELFNGDLPSR